MLKALTHLFYLELLLLFRRSQEWLYPLAFFMIVVCLFPLIFSPDPDISQKYIIGYIWIAALFANLLAIETIFAHDLKEGYLEQLLLSNLPLTFLIIIKLAAQWMMSALPLILLTPLIGFLFNLSFSTIGMVSLSLLLGTPVLTLLGSLCVTLTLELQQAGILLGLLILPLITPVLIFSVLLVQQQQNHLPFLAPLAFLAGLSFLTMTCLPWLIALTLRISLGE